MGSCCTVNRDPLQTIIPVPLTNTIKLNSEDLKDKKTSVCLSKENFQPHLFILKLLDDTSLDKIQPEKLANVDYGNFVKKRHGSIQMHYKFDSKSLGQGNFAIFCFIEKIVLLRCIWPSI